MWKRSFEKCGQNVICNTALLLLAARVLAASPNFGLEEQGQKGPQQLFAQKAFDPPCVAIYSPFYHSSQYLFDFEQNEEKI